MPSEIYFIRHGESSANVTGILCGLMDVELTEKGITQVRASAQDARELKFDFIISSPLKRAILSAEIMADSNPEARFCTSAELLEQDYGRWEGKPFEEVKRHFLKNLNPPEGETHDAFLARLKRFTIKLEQYSGRVLLVSHGGVGSQLLSEYGHPKRLIHNAELIKLL